MKTICSFCGKELFSETNENFILCKFCNKYIPQGENSYNKKEVTMVKRKITDIRIENANKVLEFLKSLELEDTEISKTLSRAYTLSKK